MNSQEARIISQYNMGPIIKQIRKYIEKDYADFILCVRLEKHQETELIADGLRQLGYKVEIAKDRYDTFSEWDSYDELTISWKI